MAIASSLRPFFVLDGTIEGWDPKNRRLRLQFQEHPLLVASAVTGLPPAKGARVTVSGHVTPLGAG